MTNTNPLLWFIFFCSGFAALVYEVSWTRQIGVILGHTAPVASLVLACYFLGMAGGYRWGGRWSKHVSPLRGYAACEVAVAVWAISVPYMLRLADLELVSAWLHSSQPVGRTIARGLFVLVAIGPGTVALGGTLPLLATSLSRSLQGADRIAVAYAWNTWGALAGVLSTSAVLLVTVGVRASGTLAAAVSLACAIGAWLLARTTPDEHQPSALAVGDVSPAKPSLDAWHWHAVIAAVSGFGALALEVLYTRLFSLVFHNSTQTFSLVIAVFLFGLALGSWISTWLLRRWPAAVVIQLAAMLTGISIVGSLAVLVSWTRLEYFPLGSTFVDYLGRSLGLAMAVMLPVAMSIGVLLPSTWHWKNSEQREIGRVVGDLTMLNTIAAAIGAVSASFVLLPMLGLWMSFAGVAVLFAGLPIAWGLLHGHIVWVGCGLVVMGITAPLWPGIQQVQGDGMELVTTPLIERWATPLPHESLVQRWETDYGWIDVTRDVRNQALRIRQNRHYSYGSTGDDSTREQRQVHLPLLLHEHPKDVLCLGLGTGLTAAGVLPHPEVEQTVVVELIPEVVEAVRLLGGRSREVIEHPSVEVRVDDARHYLATTDRRFDVIVSDLFVPWESSTGYLYTTEHYRAAQNRLRPGGLFCQWLALYQVSPREFELIADSLASVFPHVTVWWGNLSPRRGMIAFIASDTPLHIDGSQVDPRIARLKQSGQFHDPLLSTSVGLYEMWLGDWPRRPGVYLNTNEHPRVEFWTPVSHGDRLLLQQERLRTYYDETLGRLPRVSVVDQTALSPPRPPGWQREVLFPE